MKQRIAKILIALIIGFSGTVALSPSVGAAYRWHSYTYGRVGSCHVRIHGRTYAGFKEYYHGKWDGRCLLQ